MTRCIYFLSVLILLAHNITYSIYNTEETKANKTRLQQQLQSLARQQQLYASLPNSDWGKMLWQGHFDHADVKNQLEQQLRAALRDGDIKRVQLLRAAINARDTVIDDVIGARNRRNFFGDNGDEPGGGAGLV